MSKSKRKKSALIVCSNGKKFWTTQKQFWTWCRNGNIEKVNDYPLTGQFVRENEEKLVIISNTVLNLANPNHLREVLESKRFVKSK